MPCSSEHLVLTEREVESVRVLEFLREIKGLPFNHDEPYTQRELGPYGRPETLDEDTAKLCDWLTKIAANASLRLHSLELQLWWQQHQKWDKKRQAQQAAQERAAAIKREALAKLNDEERDVLGIG